MSGTREEMIESIEQARKQLNDSIDRKEDYEEIYARSIALDQLIEQFMVAGF